MKCTTRIARLTTVHLLLAGGMLWADVLPTAKQDVLALTGKRTKIVYQNHGAIKGFDTETGEETLIRHGAKDPSGAEGPFILPDGNRVVFWEELMYGRPATFVINWDGSNQRTVWRDGKPAAVHLGPATGITWVYVKDGTDVVHPIWRVQVDDTTKKELVWEGGPVGPMWFCVQTDGYTGKYKPSLVDMRTGVITDMGYTCWVGCSPDPADPDRTFIYIGDHRHILVGASQKLGSTDKRMQIEPNNEDTWGIRWTNDIRIVSTVIGGGYARQIQGGLLGF